jgi:hypothetical protein
MLAPTLIVEFHVTSTPVPPKLFLAQVWTPSDVRLHKSSSFHSHKLKKVNSVALVRKRTLPTEGPPPVGEVSANFRG